MGDNEFSTTNAWPYETIAFTGWDYNAFHRDCPDDRDSFARPVRVIGKLHCGAESHV